MKWQRKHDVNMGEVAALHLQGFSLVELSERYDIPRTTLNRYMHEDGYDVHFNRYRLRTITRARVRGIKEYVCVTAWKRAILRSYPYACQVCGYTTIVEAHHILPRAFGGKNTIDNGVILCPNHHAESHAKLIDIMALLKRGKLLGHPYEGNQQPSHASSEARGMEGSETTPNTKVVDARRLRVIGLPGYLKSNTDDIVRTADIKKKR